MRTAFLATLAAAAAISFPTAGRALDAAPPFDEPAIRYDRAVVQDVRPVTVGDDTRGEQRDAYRVRFTSGPLDGQIRELDASIASNPYDLPIEAGDRVLVQIQTFPQSTSTLLFIEGFDRQWPLLALVALFVVSLVLLAGKQGLKTAASILISIGLIGGVLIPSFLDGLNPVPIAIALAAAFSAISSGVSMGWNRKALATTIGTVGGTLAAYAIASAFSDWTHLAGLSTEEDRLFFSKNPTLAPQALFFAGVIIASMGVVEDVAVSIASGIFEVRRANRALSRRELYASGMSVGRDHLSALANTLVFAYVGASLSTLLLYSQHGGSWGKFFSFDSVSEEVIRSLAGTIGLVATVPMTALLAAHFAAKAPPERDAA
jgi:uncharacterized membrane protein